jgi:hypothetical protein
VTYRRTRAYAPVMSDTDGHYSDAELEAICAPRPLRELDANQVWLLDRHLIWSSYQRERFRALFPDSTPPQGSAFMGEEWFASLALWNSLLWVVISGFNERGIELAGRLHEDVTALSPTLKDFRNAVFHVSRESHHDPRLFRFMGDPLNVPRVYRISEGLSALFWNESEERKREGRIPDDAAEGE